MLNFISTQHACVAFDRSITMDLTFGDTNAVSDR